MDFYLQRTLDAIERETRDMELRELTWHPENKWCAAQILEHLTLAFTGTTKSMLHAMKEGVPALAPSFKQRLATTLVIGLGYFPTGREAPEFTRPRGADPGAAVANIRQALEEMDNSISDVEAKLGSGVIALHPVIGPLTARQWRKFHWEHTRHHMKQIARLRHAYAVPDKTLHAASNS